MRRNSRPHNNSYISTSTEDDSSRSIELDLLNPRKTRLRQRLRRFLPFVTQNIDSDATPNLLERSLSDRSTPRLVNRQCVESKLHSEEKKVIAAQKISNRRFTSPRDKRKYEYKVTFAEGKKSYECDKKEEEEEERKVESKEDLAKLW
ncbi:hypothetical protein V1477_017891 [Vespula maculifrons]|uniref:Uncharacterized protein n=1 Tax=Vespula maculifrons TaxID=7453 RepID=A0ABD2AZM7_VESMC